MPLYEYECIKCGHRTEVIQRLGDPPLKVCTECEGEMKRLLSAPAFQFKGSGWYVTDYGRKGSETDEAPKESKAEPKGSDSKPSGAKEGAAKSTKKDSD